jgi:hypothetical protein
MMGRSAIGSRLSGDKGLEGEWKGSHIVGIVAQSPVYSPLFYYVCHHELKHVQVSGSFGSRIENAQPHIDCQAKKALISPLVSSLTRLTYSRACGIS